MSLGEQQIELFQGLIFQAKMDLNNQAIRQELRQSISYLCQNLSSETISQFLIILNDDDIEQIPYLKLFSQSSFYQAYRSLSQAQNLSAETFKGLLNHSHPYQLDSFIQMIKKTPLLIMLQNKEFVLRVLNDQKIDSREELFHYCFQRNLIDHNNCLKLFSVRNIVLFLFYLIDLNRLNILNFENFNQAMAYPRPDRLIDTFNYLETFIQPHNAQIILDIITHHPHIQLIQAVDVSKQDLLFECLSPQYHTHFQKILEADIWNSKNHISLQNLHLLLSLKLDTLESFLQAIKEKALQNPEFDLSTHHEFWWSDRIKTFKLIEEHQLQEHIGFVFHYDKPFSIYQICQLIFSHQPAEEFMHHFAFYENQQAIHETTLHLIPETIASLPLEWREHFKNFSHQIEWCSLRLLEGAPLTLAPLTQSHYMQCLAELRGVSPVDEETVSVLLNKRLPHDFGQSLKMLSQQDLNFLSAKFFNQLICRISRFKNHQAITELLLDLLEKQVLHNEYFEPMMAILDTHSASSPTQKIYFDLLMTALIKLFETHELYLPPNLIDKLHCDLDLLSLYELMNLIISKKVYALPAQYTQVFEMLVHSVNHKLLVSNIKKIQNSLSKEKLGVFILKLLSSSSYSVINQIMSHIHAEQSHFEDILEIFNILPMNLLELNTFTQQYHLFNSKICQLFKNHLFYFSGVFKKLQFLIESGYMDKNDQAFHFKFFQMSSKFETDGFIKILDKYHLVTADQKQSFFRDILKQSNHQEISIIFTFLANFKVDFNCSEFRQAFPVILSSTSPFDAASLFGQLYLFGKFKFLNFEEYKQICQDEKFLGKLVSKFGHFTQLAWIPAVQQSIQAMSSEHARGIRQIINALLQKELLYPQCIGSLEENAIGLSQCQHPQTLLQITQHLKPGQVIRNFNKLFNCDLASLLTFLEGHAVLNEQTLDIFSEYQIDFSQVHPLLRQRIQDAQGDKNNFYSYLMLINLSQKINPEKLIAALDKKPNIMPLLNQISPKEITNIVQAQEIEMLLQQLTHSSIDFKKPEITKFLSAVMESPSPLSAMMLFHFLTPDKIILFSSNDLKKLMRNPHQLNNIIAICSHHIELIKELKIPELYELILMLHEANQPAETIDWYLFLTQNVNFNKNEVLSKIREIQQRHDSQKIKDILTFLSHHQLLSPEVCNILLGQKSLESTLDFLGFLYQHGKLDKYSVTVFLTFRQAKIFFQALLKYQAHLQQKGLVFNAEVIQLLFDMIKHSRATSQILEYFEILYAQFELQDIQLLTVLNQIHQHLRADNFKDIFDVLIKNGVFSLEIIHEFVQKDSNIYQFKKQIVLMHLLYELNPAFTPQEILVFLRTNASDMLLFNLLRYQQFHAFDYAYLRANLLSQQAIWTPLAKFFYLANKLGILNEQLFEEITSLKDIMFNDPRVIDLFLQIRSNFISAINLRQFLKITQDHQTHLDVNSMNRDLIKFCSQLLNHSQNAQNTHTKSVHESTSKSALRLLKRYGRSPMDIEERLENLKSILAENIKQFEKDLQHVENQEDLKDKIFKTKTALRCIQRLIQPDWASCTDDGSGITIIKLLALCIQALHDKAVLFSPFAAAVECLTQGLFDIQRDKNNTNDKSSPDSWICSGGTFNKLIESLSCIHPDCEQIILNLEMATLKFQRLVVIHTKAFLAELPSPRDDKELEEFLKMIQSVKDEDSIIWPRIRNKVAEELFGVYGDYFGTPTDIRMTTLLDYGHIVGSEELKTFVDTLQEAKLLGYQRQKNQFFSAQAEAGADDEELNQLEEERSKTTNSSTH